VGKTIINFVYWNKHALCGENYYKCRLLE
jgi:hypothetical protein